jgi:hypothetical protein
MDDTLMGVATGLCGHIAANELLSESIREVALGCKSEVAAMAARREGK